MEYLNDTTEILGGILPHDDSVNDRAPGSKLCTAESFTTSSWSGIYVMRENYMDAKVWI